MAAASVAAMSHPTRRDVVAQFIPNSPLVAHLGIRVAELGDDRAVLVLPFAEQNVTIGDVVHGGAISALIDTAGMAAAWCNDDPPGSGGGTISLNVDFAAPAARTDLTATAVAYRRGGRTCFCDVTVVDEGGAVVAKGLMTHRYA
jgi:uncharacterized protein (TIGR00369 family)